MMQFTIFTLGALAASAVCSPLAMPAAVAGELETRQANNCTGYYSDLSGYVCTVRPYDCSAFYTVQPSDTCLSIGKVFNNFTLTQFYKWNPSIGQTCSGLQAYVPVCINTPWYHYTPPVQPPFGTHWTPDQTPVPTMPNVISSCQIFELVEPGKPVVALAAENGFDQSKFAEWNGGATTAWASYWACVKA
ncbi:uncharacterized protein MYCFIDRAFT_86673 [Pseudocercospora fijiensis CIRAD86]|uniref:LysM domain-containing protein n=1 Tax=Pseudocercospora fijiensis (strain CIRAD86) TaxID=383855 RepID=M3AY22_PSEFD|nr:uncharacterized protein MYCFIDRAFT_86673 [Pseudocercospora fijiensis CIRAD86]EME82053.1 hypothetical protein MYCFIDRAFT_86673 [Pseudocercospora fijiensis CIRAD86]